MDESKQKDAIKSIASVSTLLRNAIAAALPVAPEQYMTIAVPGTVIDLDDYDLGGSLVYDVRKHAVPPTTVRQSEARLVDGMMPIANIMATISSSDGVRSPGNPAYDESMSFLKAKGRDGRTVVEFYRDKQIAWGNARSEWDEARLHAEAEAEEKFPSTSGVDYIGRQKKYINDWNQQNYFRYKTATQAAWMDWVVNGDKYNVEFNFGRIDIDSIMARIEASKESLRNSTIPDADGASEVYGVTLAPIQWAMYCKRKSDGWYERNGTYTLGQLDNEIARLQNLLQSYEKTDRMIDEEGRVYPVHNAQEPKVKTEDTRATLDAKTEALYRAQGDLAGAKWNNDQVQNDPNTSDEDKTAAISSLEAAKQAVAAAQKEVQDAQRIHDNAVQEWHEYSALTLQGNALKDVKSWTSTKKSTIQTQLNLLRDLRAEKVKQSPMTVQVILSATAPKMRKTTILLMALLLLQKVQKLQTQSLVWRPRVSLQLVMMACVLSVRIHGPP